MSEEINLYISDNLDGRTPNPLVPFSHIKCKSDRTKTIIMTKEKIKSPSLFILRTEDEIKFILDAWIDEENENATEDPITKTTPHQEKINLKNLIKNADKLCWRYIV